MGRQNIQPVNVRSRSYVMKCQIGLNGHLQKVSQRFCEMLEYTEDQLLQCTLDDICHPADNGKDLHLAQKIRKGEFNELETKRRLITKAGKTVWVQLHAVLIKDKNGVDQYVVCYLQNIKMQWGLKKSETQWQRLVENNPQPIQITVDGKIVFINKLGVSLYGANSSEELIGKSIYDFIDTESIKTITQQKFAEGPQDNGKQVGEYTMHRMDGERRDVEIYSRPVTYKGKAAVQTVVHDITDWKKKQQAIKTSLNEKKTFLKEIHHRVKNNLAVISATLELQAMNTENQCILNTLRDSQYRINSIAMIHEKLYESESLSDIEFSQYISELVSAISRTFDTSNKDIVLELDLDEFMMDVKMAIPCGLILNELVTNCYKHAFSGRKTGAIAISVYQNHDDYIIKVEDDGGGLPEDFNMKEQQGLGMTLIQALISQLEGTISTMNHHGASFRISFGKNG